MRYKHVIILIILLVSSISGIPLTQTSQVNQQPPNALNFLPEQNFVIRLVNFDSSLVDLNNIDAALPNSVIQQQYTYNINYDINFTNSTYESSINSYINSISTIDWTSELNVTALKEQKANFGRKDIFTQTNGTAINAGSLEDYLAQNKPETTLEDKNRYYIFLFNLSQFDHQGNHWLNQTEYDIDSQQPRNFWRLEWDYPRNYDVKFPYAAYSNESDIAIIDPTSHQWYLNWRNIWNTGVSYHPSYNNTLSELVNSKSTDTEKQAIIEDTLIEWSHDWIAHIFDIYTSPLELGTSVDVQLRAVYNSSVRSKNELDWIINDQLITKSTNFILHSEDLVVNTTYIDISSDTWMKNYIDSKQVSYSSYHGEPSPFEDWRYYDGTNIWNDVYDSNSELRNRYFDTQGNKITIRGIVLLFDNASYTAPDGFIPWAGDLYTGLGGGQVVTMLWEHGRAFTPDGSRKAGLSKVLIHEIGHSIGFPHPFSDTFTSDFANDVMGYYPASANYTQIVSNAYFRTAADKKIRNVINSYNELVAKNGSDNPDFFNEVANNFTDAKSEHSAKQYFNAWKKLNLLESSLENYQNTGETGDPSKSVTTSSETSSEETDETLGIADLPHSLTFSVLGLLIVSVIYVLKDKNIVKKQN